MKNYTKEQIKLIIDYYTINCISTYKIAKLFNCSQTTINTLLTKNKVKIRTRSNAALNKTTKYTKNTNYFSEINSIDKAYFLGLLIADGNNDRRLAGQVSINLIELDKDILLIFKNQLNYNGELKLIKNKNYQNQYKLIIASKKLSDDLFNLGMISKKDFATYFPPIKKEFYSHFIRGIFDGDGCIHKNKRNQNTIYITGNFNLIKTIYNILLKECNLNNTKLKKIGNKSTTTLVFSGNNQVKKIGKYMYNNCKNFYIKRKKEKFDL